MKNSDESSKKIVTKEEAIKTIKDLYPPDATYPGTARKGRRLLDQAKQNLNLIDHSAWTKLPKDLLIEFAKLCLEAKFTS